MTIDSKTAVIVAIALVIGLGLGFVLRPVILAAGETAPADPGVPVPALPVQAEARGTQYFAAHIEEARQIVAACEAGTERGDECANAGIAATEAQGKDRLRGFLGN
ncbi:MAG: hypothetical protein WCZ28_08420 [Burkholderiaceae bacterium]